MDHALLVDGIDDLFRTEGHGLLEPIRQARRGQDGRGLPGLGIEALVEFPIEGPCQERTFAVAFGKSRDQIDRGHFKNLQHFIRFV